MKENLMETPVDIEWWRWKMFKQVTEIIHNPSEYNIARLRALADGFRRYSEQLDSPGSADSTSEDAEAVEEACF